jgi:hypothetical protein
MSANSRDPRVQSRGACGARSCSGGYAEQIAVGIGQYGEVSIVGVVPFDSLSAQPDQTLGFGLLIGLSVSSEVEVSPVFIVEVETSADSALWHQERRIVRCLRTPECRRPERTSRVPV